MHSPDCYIDVLIIASIAARERERVQKVAAQRLTTSASGSSSGTPSGATTPKKSTNIKVNLNTSIKFSAPSTSAKGKKLDQSELDISALGLEDPSKKNEAEEPVAPEEVPKASLAREKLLEEAQRVIDGGSFEGKKAVSIVVIGIVILSIFGVFFN